MRRHPGAIEPAKVEPRDIAVAALDAADRVMATANAALVATGQRERERVLRVVIASLTVALVVILAVVLVAAL